VKNPYPPRTAVVVRAEGRHHLRLGFIAEWSEPTGVYIVGLVRADQEEPDYESFEPHELAVLVPAEKPRDEPDGEDSTGDNQPDVPVFGMTRDTLAEYLADFIDVSMARATEPGKAGEELPFLEFETEDFKELLHTTLSEIETAAVELAKSHIRVRRVIDAIGDSL
jgi:hypothetical protein